MENMQKELENSVIWEKSSMETEINYSIDHEDLMCMGKKVEN